MKRLIICTLMNWFVFMIAASSLNDSLLPFQQKLDSVTRMASTLSRENESLQKEILSLTNEIQHHNDKIDSINHILAVTGQNISTLADSLDINISDTQARILSNSDTLSQTIEKKSQTGLWIVIALALIMAVIAFIFGRKLAKCGDEVASLSAKADKLNEEIVGRMSKELLDMQSISKHISSLASTPAANPDTEQKLILTLADRITFMEITLYKMDSSIRGYRQLYMSIKQMKDNLLANGYELVDMLGKNYHDGMKVTAYFVEDENLQEGEQVITGIIKPQINYKGKMIQSAQITVSQNL